jgi:hypothetical protein
LHERRLVGCNPGHDVQLYALLYELDEPQYVEAADAAIAWFFDNARSGQNGQVREATDLLAWGEHASWDPLRDIAVTATIQGRPIKHEYFEHWPFWDRTHRLAPEAADAHALGLFGHQLIDQATGLFNRDAPYDGVVDHSDRPYDFPRHAGYYLNAWAAAVADDSVTASDAELLEAIDVLLSRYEQKRALSAKLLGPGPGYVAFTVDARDRAGIPENAFASLSSNLEFAIHAHAAAELLEGLADPALVDRLRQFAVDEDGLQLRDDHDPAGEGLVTGVDIRIGKVVQRRSKRWGRAYGGGTMGTVAVKFLDRHAQLVDADPETAAMYAQLIRSVADVYANSPIDGTNGEPADGDLLDEPVWPTELADVIALLLFAHKLDGDGGYLEAAVRLGDVARDAYFDGHPLPRAAGPVAHYESVTGGDDLALALLHLDRALRE